MHKTAKEWSGRPGKCDEIPRPSWPAHPLPYKKLPVGRWYRYIENYVLQHYRVAGGLTVTPMIDFRNLLFQGLQQLHGHLLDPLDLLGRQVRLPQ